MRPVQVGPLIGANLFRLWLLAALGLLSAVVAAEPARAQMVALDKSQPVRRHLGQVGHSRARPGAQVSWSSPSNKLAFSNQTGAVIQCGVARELRQLIAKADQASARRQRAQTGATPLTAPPPADVRTKWLKESGEELEPELYAEPSQLAEQHPLQDKSGVLLRFVRPADSALVFEPFRAAEFRPDVHMASYRCVAWSEARGASLAGTEIHVRAEVAAQPGAVFEVLDQLVLEGNSAQFRCQLTSQAHQNQFTVLDWLESLPTGGHESSVPVGADTVYNFQATTQAYLQRANSTARYFVDQSTGDLHIVNADLSLNYRTYRCRCKNRLTGEVLISSNRGKLIVTESRTPVAPHLIGESSVVLPVQEEGESSILACGMQAYPRAQFSWFRRVAGELYPVATSADGPVLQVGALLLFRRVSRNDSGSYLCVAKNEAGEERLEFELGVRARLRARLTSSASVLELGKSLALDCSVSGHPINQLVFTHNQNVIKSVGVESLLPSAPAELGEHPMSAGPPRPRQRHMSSPTNYFVVDESRLSAANLGHSEQSDSTSADEEESGERPDEPEQRAPNASQPLGPKQTQLNHVIVIVLEPQHAGAYQCFAYNQFESVQSSAYIRVLDDPPKFRDTFRSQVLEQGQDISLLCSAGANPLPEITWTVDEQPIPESGRTRFGDFVTKDNLVISYVNISQAQVVDGGLYRCTADNGLAQTSHQALVSVAGEPVVKQMANQTVVAGTALLARCPVAGHPLLEVHWLHNGRRVPANHRQRVLDNGTLLVEHMEKAQNDQGEYTCVVRAPGGQSAQGSFQVAIKVRPSIEPFALGRSLREGQRASIMCTISSGDLPIAISWFRNEQPIGELAGEQQAANLAASTLRGVRISRVSDYSSTLLFESLLAEHTANYTCLARNDAGQVSHQAPMIVQVAPKWTVEPAEASVVRGGSTSIQCSASGFPAPRITWTKAGESQPARASGLQQQPGSWRPIVSSPHLQVYESGSLNILDARDSDHGLYMCQASNGVGPGLSKVIRVTVNVGAQFGSRHAVQYASRGEQSQLKCQAKGDWPLSVRWFKNKARLEPINVRETPVRQTSSASVLLLGPGDQVGQNLALANDQYQKSAGLLMQRYSLATAEILLNRPASEQSQAEVQQQQQAQSAELTKSGEQSGQPLAVQVTSVLSISQVERQDTGTFKCLAVNTFGMDERIIQLIVQEPPDRVDELTAADKGSRSITLAWSAPYDGQTPLLAYHVQYRPDLAPSPAFQPAQKQHLSADPPGSLDWFNYTLPVVEQPSAPYNGNSQEATKAEAAGLAAAVNPAPSGGRPLVKLTISSLRPMTSYWFRVQAENKLGPGPLSSPLQASTIEEAPSGAPTKLKAVAQSSSSILVSWSRLEPPEQVHGYYLGYKPLGDLVATSNGTFVTHKQPASELEQQPSNIQTYKTVQHDDKLSKFDALLTGLKRSTKYVISVQAFNRQGSGPASDPIHVRTLDTDPPKQAALKNFKSSEGGSVMSDLTDGGAHQLPVAMPLSGGSPDQMGSSELVDYYSLYQAELNEHPHWQEIRLPGYAASHTLDNLKCGTRYQFYMMGVNKIGVGDQSDILDTKTTGGRPLAPDRQLTLDVINTTCYHVRFDRWHDNGCPIIEFKVKSKPEFARDWLQQSSYEVTSTSDAPSNPAESDRSDSLPAWPSKRTRRLANLDDSSYAMALVEEDPAPDDDAFLDYATDMSADYNIRESGSASSYNSSQLLDLLKDSMVSSFDPLKTKSSNQLSDLRSSLLVAEPKEPRTVAIDQRAKQQDWRRVKLCNLLENTYYQIKVTARNSVGETDMDLRLLTSPEGLEFDHDVKRQVIVRSDGVGRASHSAIAAGDKLTFYSLGSHWSILVPVTLLIAFTTVVVTVMLLLRRSSSSSSSTSTTFSGSTTTNHHCSGSSYMNDSSPAHQHYGPDIACSDRPIPTMAGLESLSRQMGDQGTLKSIQASHMNDGSSNIVIYSQHQRMANCQLSSNMDEPTYGHSTACATGNRSGNQSVNSPATTIAGLSASLHSGSTTNGSSTDTSGVFLRAELGSNSQHLTNQRGRVYLCAKQGDSGMVDESETDGATYYGMGDQASELSVLYGPTATQLRHIQQQAIAQKQIDAGELGSGAQKMDNNCFLTIVEQVARSIDEPCQQMGSANLASLPAKGFVGCQQAVTTDDQCRSSDYLMGHTNYLPAQDNQQLPNNYTVTNIASNANDLRADGICQAQQIEAQGERLIFDPAYSTIRRNFPQTFRYLTLQQSHSMNGHNNHKIAAGSSNQMISNSDQRNQNMLTGSPLVSNPSGQVNNGNLMNQQHLAYDLDMTSSNNLAALNLLTTNQVAQTPDARQSR